MISVYKASEDKLINVGGGSGDNIPVYTTEEYEQIKDTIPEGTKFIISDDYQEKDGNWLKGKTINFLGDSITRGSWYLNGEWQGYMDNPYPSIVASILGCTSNNFGESGTAIEHRGESGRSFVDRVNELPAADMNVMFGGVNDIPGGTLGNKDSTDIATVYGALKVIAQTFLDKNPKSINVFISPMMSNLTTGAIKYDEIRQAISYVAHMYGFIFIDASVEAPMMNPNIDILNDTWLNGNLVHPNPEYHQLLGKWLANKLVALDSSNIEDKALKTGCVTLPEIRSNGHKYLKLTWNALSNASELCVRLIGSYGGELIITGNPYYDSSYRTEASTTSIKAEITDSIHWDPKNMSDYFSNIYIVTGAIYIEFNGAVAITPIVMGDVSTFGVSLEWADSWDRDLGSNGRILQTSRQLTRLDVGEVGGSTLKGSLSNFVVAVNTGLTLQKGRPYIVSGTYNDKIMMATVIKNTKLVMEITCEDGMFRIDYTPSVAAHFYQLTETEI